MIPWGNFLANKWPILMGLGNLIMTQICAYKVPVLPFPAYQQALLIVHTDFCMKQRLFPRVRPNDPFTFNTSVARLYYFFFLFIKKKFTYTILKLWSTTLFGMPNRSVWQKKYRAQKVSKSTVFQSFKKSHFTKCKRSEIFISEYVYSKKSELSRLFP